MRLHVGCAMWTHAPWQGRLIPHPLPPSERLRAYASWCNAVEGNTTFYATPALATVESWAAQTAEDFRFVLKLPKTVTHERRLRGADAELQSFFTAMEPLGPRNHAFWIQLPGSFGPADLGTLATFLYRLPRSYRYAVEVRHPSFFDDERSARQLEQVLGRVGAEWVLFDTVTLFGTPATSYAEREAWMKKPRVLRRSRALTDRPIVRYIGRDDPALTMAGWAYLVRAVVDWLAEGRSPTVFLHTPDNVDALKLARRFYDEVRTLVPGLAPLPEPLPAAPETLF
ncbi:DUF72 domain-containing protein [Kribbella qitaiheensis]|uniref:DUF72 domain-containing protein n=1 Tax=Kribbella qitaiheensis TaxID=1544730 RepID=A0A7G6X0R0_9ACTN|nr:DUF72 domain-containing protein [Kribbella qitaiheensis]QNE19825.1 DUF72 domain-containing protein [Kribbella qitaiheensis]